MSDKARIERLERIVVILVDRLVGRGDWTDKELDDLTNDIEIRVTDYSDCKNCQNGKLLPLLRVCGICGRDLQTYREQEYLR